MPDVRNNLEWEATRLARRAANAAALAVSVFLALFVFSAEIPSVRAHSPWAEDPYDAVVSFSVLLVVLVASVTFVRCQRWRGPRPMPPQAIRYVLRGVSVVLAAVGATVVADTAALSARARAETWGPWFDELVGLLLLTGVLAAVAAALLVHAWRCSRNFRDDTSLTEQDALDDALALLADVGTILGERLPRLGNVLVSGARRSATAIEASPLNPRRHPWVFCFAFALLSGTVFSSWHSFVEGVPRDPSLALQVWLLYAGILASGVVVGYVLLGRYLALIRHQQNQAHFPPR